MRLDHLSYAAGPEGLAACVQRLGARLGAGFTDGGLHPRFGTRNFVLPLAGGCYVEVVEALDHPSAESAPFGRAVKARTAAGGGWLAWVVRLDDIAAAEARLGRPAVDGHRRRPDGVDLRWRQIGVLDTTADPQLPFFIQWLSDAGEHPSDGGSAIALSALVIAGDHTRVERYLDANPAQPLEDITVEWLAAEAPPAGETGAAGPDASSSTDTGLVRAVFTTPQGDVVID